MEISKSRRCISYDFLGIATVHVNWRSYNSEVTSASLHYFDFYYKISIANFVTD